jgi:hypothetical protein
MIHAASMIRRSVLIEYPYNEEFAFGSDYDMNLRISAAGVSLDHTSSYLIVRRMHDRNVTVTNNDEQKITGSSSAVLHRDQMSDEEQKKVRAEGLAAELLPVRHTPHLSEISAIFPWIEVKEEDYPEPQITSTYDVAARWKQVGNILYFDALDTEIFFEMPHDWHLEDSHPDLFHVAHYVMMNPWEKDILKDWKPSRRPGWRPGLAFSGGIDSTAAMLLMPQLTVLIYNERSEISTILDHTNAFRFIKYLEDERGQPIIRMKSNHESIRMSAGKGPGFSTDYACAVQVILLADYLGLDSMGTGMPLENSYFFHGYRYRNFGESHFWINHSKIFDSIGLSIYQPVAGCSEVINAAIVQANGLTGLAQSCLRSNKGGEVCGQCWKCFRKNTLVGHPFSLNGEIETFLKKKPLKQAVSTLYSIEKAGVSDEGVVIVEKYPDIQALLHGSKFDWLERFNPLAIELIPQKYRLYTQARLHEYAEIMDSRDISMMESIDLYPEIP